MHTMCHKAGGEVKQSERDAGAHGDTKHSAAMQTACSEEQEHSALSRVGGGSPATMGFRLTNANDRGLVTNTSLALIV
jgi:hypothetical protein